MAGKNALIAVTSFNDAFYADGSKTGLFIVEALHPFNVYKAKGYNVTFVSETGSYGFDAHSFGEDFLNGQDKIDFENENSDFQKGLKSMKKAADIDPKDYQIFFASAGHGTLFDYPKAKNLQRIASEIYANGGIVAAVCHGPAIFDGLMDKATGKPLIEGKSITGFTDVGEVILQVDGIMKDHKLNSVETVAKKYGAKYLAPIGPWDDFSITDGRVVTGVNPASAGSTATRTIIALEQQ